MVWGRLGGSGHAGLSMAWETQCGRRQTRGFNMDEQRSASRAAAREEGRGCGCTCNMGGREHSRASEKVAQQMREAYRRAELASQGLRLAQDELDNAEDECRSARREMLTAETEVSIAAAKVSRHLEKWEAFEASLVVPTMRSMVEAMSARQVSDLLAHAKRAEDLLSTLQHHDATVDTEVWAGNDEDMQAV